MANALAIGWTPSNLKLGEIIGFFTFGDLPGVTSITFNQAHAIAGFDIEGTTAMTSLSFPNLVDIDPSNIEGGFIFMSGNSALTTLSLPLLETMGGEFDFQNNSALTTFSLPSFTNSTTNLRCYSNSAMATISLPVLTTVAGDLTFNSSPSLTTLSIPSLTTVSGIIDCLGDSALVTFSAPSLITSVGGFNCFNCTSLENVSLPVWVPTNGSSVTFSNCALSAASVELILHICAQAGVTGCTIGLQGGTNAGLLSLSAQGQADYASLAPGNTVLINP